MTYPCAAKESLGRDQKRCQSLLFQWFLYRISAQFFFSFMGTCEPTFSELKEEGLFTVSVSAAFYTECGYVVIWNAADFTEKMFILFQKRLTYSLISFRETF